MEREVPRAWVRVTARLRPDGIVALDAIDDRGRRADGPPDHLRPSTWGPEWTSKPAASTTSWTLAFSSRLVQMILGVSERLGDFRSETWEPAAPLFVDAEDAIAALPLGDAILAAIGAEQVSHNLGSLGDRRSIVVATMPPGGPSAPAPRFALPLRITAVGMAGQDTMLDLRARNLAWLRSVDFEPVERAPAEVTLLPAVDVAGDMLALGGADVTIAHRDDLALLRSIPKGEVALAIVLTDGAGGSLETLAIAPAWARSAVVVPGTVTVSAIEIVEVLLDALSHDLPLHDAVAETIRRTRAVLDLVASPETVHDLRLSTVWDDLEREETALISRVGELRSDTFERLDSLSDPPAMIRRFLDRQAHTARSSDPLAELRADMRLTEVSFNHETEGLLPLRRAQIRLERGHELERWLGNQQPERLLTSPTPRVVDIRLRHGDLTVAPFARSVYVGRDMPLLPGSRYALEVQIGAPSPASLVAGPVEPIDLMLPDLSAGHDLDVSIFSDSFDMPDTRTQRITLPRAGGSDVASFDVRTPVSSTSAWIRVCVYFRDHLVQTFILDARVAPPEAVPDVGGEDDVTARLEHSLTHDWDDLDALAPRSLSMVLNDHAGDHRLFLKRENATGMVPFAPETITAAARRVREALRGTGGPPEAEAAADAVWALAREGARLFTGLFQRVDDEMRAALRALRASTGDTVQITRVDANTGLPWSLVYDWDLPADIVGAPRPDVCLGRSGEAPCGHGPDDGAVCIYGFWGLRHLVEELLPDRAGRSPAPQVPLAPGGVLSSIGVKPDRATETLVTALDALVGVGPLTHLGPMESFKSQAFDDPVPGVVLVLGHFAHASKAGEPAGDRIGIAGRERWLNDALLQGVAVRSDPWQATRPLVLLLACGSVEVAAAQLTSLLTAFDTVHAGAIVGTECDIESDVASTFALSLIRAMTAADTPATKRAGFGDAVFATRRSLVVDQGDTRGLAFTALGPAGLVLV
ncbi:hypothetical protein [Demequina mangrovi]|uniref:CHAT domain-containing protein n=1 Tax=Demequina mangrovi TaxID=1043493 RepID=A0A1H6VIJ4_9MICO|nr:hypothetical protein [Demequina mangrovi]SEJ00172.1 hypothetical protein SAMN05421637_0697 [Demequina mangrovi]